MTDGSHYFMPEKFTVGMFNYGGRKDPGYGAAKATAPISDTAVVSCRYRNRTWLQSAAFERLTGGFRPSAMRDAAKQLRKEVSASVVEYDNTPISGFRVLRDSENLYGRSSIEYDYVGDVVVRDPRGFAFGMSHPAFFDTLRANGWNMTDGVLDGEYAYAWTDGGVRHELTLVPVSDPDFKAILEASRAFAGGKGKASASLPKSALTPGKLYKAHAVLDGWYMYVGEYDTYSAACHLDALENGAYDVDARCEEEKGAVYGRWDYRFPTGRSKMVFYTWENGLKDPFVVRSSVNGIFCEERYPDPIEAIPMFDDPDRLASFEDVRESMSGSIGFSKLDLSRTGSFRKMEFGTFEAMFPEALRQTAQFGSPTLPPSSPCETPFPFRRWPSPKIARCGGRWIQFRTDNACMRSADWRFIDLQKTPSSSFGQRYARGAALDAVAFMKGRMSVREVYDKFAPEIPDLWLENGRPAPDGACACLIPKSVTEDAWI